MGKALVAVAVILVVLLGWIWVDGVYQAFARRHPQLGPFRRPYGGDGGCRCSGGHCATDPDGGCEPPAKPSLIPLKRRAS